MNYIPYSVFVLVGENERENIGNENKGGQRKEICRLLPLSAVVSEELYTHLQCDQNQETTAVILREFYNGSLR